MYTSYCDQCHKRTQITEQEMQRSPKLQRVLGGETGGCAFCFKGNVSVKRCIERKEITLSCMNGRDEAVSVQVMARVCGSLAIHKAIGNARGYTLTHLPSSVALSSGFRMPVSVQEQALEDIASLMDWSLSYDEICSIWVHNKTVKESVLSRIRRLHD